MGGCTGVLIEVRTPINPRVRCGAPRPHPVQGAPRVCGPDWRVRDPDNIGAMDALRQTVAENGARGLYKGMGAPLATVAALNAVLFTARGQMEILVRKEPGLPLSVSDQIKCGAVAGMVVSFIACPTELVKCRLQAQSNLAIVGTSGLGSAAAVKYDGPIDVARQVLRSEGSVRGFFKGMIPTFCREVPGNALLFGIYEGLKQFMAGGHDTSQLGRGALLTAGGVACASFWVFVYPTDVVKSVIQVDDFRETKYSGTLDALRKIMSSEGLKGLYKGMVGATTENVSAKSVLGSGTKPCYPKQAPSRSRKYIYAFPTTKEEEAIGIILKLTPVLTSNIEQKVVAIRCINQCKFRGKYHPLGLQAFGADLCDRFGFDL
eukprot:Gb_41789 [translate_table: standard]